MPRSRRLLSRRNQQGELDLWCRACSIEYLWTAATYLGSGEHLATIAPLAFLHCPYMRCEDLQRGWAGAHACRLTRCLSSRRGFLWLAGGDALVGTLGRLGLRGGRLLGLRCCLGPRHPSLGSVLRVERLDRREHGAQGGICSPVPGAGSSPSVVMQHAQAVSSAAIRRYGCRLLLGTAAGTWWPYRVRDDPLWRSTACSMSMRSIHELVGILLAGASGCLVAILCVDSTVEASADR
jgi:hypothetical protein